MYKVLFFSSPIHLSLSQSILKRELKNVWKVSQALSLGQRSCLGLLQKPLSLLPKAAFPYVDQSFSRTCSFLWHSHSWDDVVTHFCPSCLCWILFWRRFQAFSTFKTKDIRKNYSKNTVLELYFCVMQMCRPYTDGTVSVWPVSEWPLAPTACWALHWRALPAWRWTTGSAAGAARLLLSRRLALLSLTLPGRGNKGRQVS